MNEADARKTSPAGELHKYPGPLIRFAKFGLVAILAANVLLLAHFIAYGYKAYFNSDSATKNLLAQRIYETGQFFPQDWVYVNGDLMVVFGHLFILPFLPFLENNYALHAVAGAISAGLILSGVWFVSGILSRSPWTRLACVAITASGLSGITSESLFGQVSYGTVFYLACFTLYFGWRLLQANGRAVWGWCTAFAVLSLLLFWSNPQRAMASYALPLIAAVLASLAPEVLRVPWRGNLPAKRGLLLLSMLGVGAAVGIALHSWILADAHNIAGAATAQWLSFGEMTKNFTHTTHGILAVLGGTPPAAGAVTTLSGLYAGGRLLAILALVLVLPSALSKGLADREKGVRYVAAFAIASLVLFLFLQVTTTIAEMTDPEWGPSRYLVVPLLFGLYVFVWRVMDRPAGVAMRVIGAVSILLLATSVLTGRNLIAGGLITAHPEARSELISILESNGLSYGYGSYWNAGALTVLSGHGLRVRPVQVIDGLPVPMRHLSSDDWYEKSAWDGRTFLLLQGSEVDAVNWQVIESYMGKPSSTISHGDHTAFVYPRNLAAALPNWHDSPSGPVSLRLQEGSLHQVGTLDTEGGPGRLVARQGEAGFLHFGPYMSLARGRYRAVFDVETAAGRQDASFGTVDVHAGGGVILATRAVTQAGRHEVVLDFTVPRNLEKTLELRVATSGAGNFTLHGIEVAPAD